MARPGGRWEHVTARGIVGGIFVVFAVQKVAPMDWSKIVGAKIKCVFSFLYSQNGRPAGGDGFVLSVAPCLGPPGSIVLSRGIVSAFILSLLSVFLMVLSWRMSICTIAFGLFAL